MLQHPEPVELLVLLVIVRADALKTARAVAESMCQDANLSLAEGNYLTLEIAQNRRLAVHYHVSLLGSRQRTPLSAPQAGKPPSQIITPGIRDNKLRAKASTAQE